MRRHRTILLVALAAAACGDDPPAPSPAAPRAADRTPTARAARPDATQEPAPPQSPLLRDGDVGGWTPSPADCEAAASLVRAVDEGRLREFLDAMPLADRVRLLRAGLRLADDRAARIAAENCRREWLDLWELRRVSELLVAAAFDPSYRGSDGGPVACDDLYEFADASAMSDVLRRLAEVRGERVPDLTGWGTLHKLVQAEHVTALVALARHDDVRVRRFAYEMLAQSVRYADREPSRAAIASVIPSDALEIRVSADDPEPQIDADALDAWRARAAPPAPPPPDRAAIEAALAGDDAEAARDALEEIAAATVLPGPWASAHPEPWSAGLDHVLVASALPWDVLLDAAVAMPGCRTRPVVEAAAARLPDLCPFAASGHRDPYQASRLALLETAARDAFVAKLRRWATADPPSDVATRLLLDLRDVQSAPAVVALCERLRAENRANVPWERLGAFRHPSVRAFLVRHVESAEGTFPPSVTAALESLAVQDGFPEGVGSWPWPASRDEKLSIARLVLAGKAVEAFVATLAYAPDAPQEGEGRVDDPRVRAHLASIRDRRETGQHFVALAELARADPAAWLDLLYGLVAGGYRWTEDVATVAGRRFLADDTLLHWVNALESNCCTAATVGAFLDDVFGWDPKDFVEFEPGRWTPAGAFHAWWDRHEHRFVFSRIADLWVPETR